MNIMSVNIWSTFWTEALKILGRLDQNNLRNHKGDSEMIISVKMMFKRKIPILIDDSV